MVTILFPCRNESATIGECITSAQAEMNASGIDFEVLVVDSDSQDDSYNRAVAAGARVVKAPSVGYGVAVRKGIEAARGEWILLLDADQSYPIEFGPFLIGLLAQGQADIVLGSRLRGNIEPGAMPSLNRFLGTPILSLLIRQLHGVPTTDCNSGMRAFRRASALDWNLQCDGMELASEMLIESAAHGSRYAEVPINFFRDGRSRPSHLRPWRDGVRHLGLIASRWFLGHAEQWTREFP